MFPQLSGMLSTQMVGLFNQQDILHHFALHWLTPPGLVKSKLPRSNWTESGTACTIGTAIALRVPQAFLEAPLSISLALPASSTFSAWELGLDAQLQVAVCSGVGDCPEVGKGLTQRPCFDPSHVGDQS